MKLFDRIAKHPKKLTQNEALLVDYIVSFYPQGILGSATDIAKKVKVSPSTVVRFFAKLGYESFGHLQREVRTEVSSKLASPFQRAHLTIKEESAPNTILDRVFTFDKDNLNATREANSVEQFQGFVDSLNCSDGGKVYLLGSKNSYPVAHYLHTHLNMCMANVHLLGTGGGLLADELLWVSPRDVLVAVSIRRYAKHVIQAARHFRQLDASVLSITDSPLAPIVGLSDHRLLIQTASTSPFDSYTAGFTLCNAIVAAVALRRKKDTEALLKRGEQVWNHFDVFLGS